MYRTPEFVIWIVQLVRLLWRMIWFILRHPLLDVVAGLILLLWVKTGWPGLAMVASVLLVALVVLRLVRPDWFARFVAVPLHCRWRWWFYRRRWRAVHVNCTGDQQRPRNNQGPGSGYRPWPGPSR